MIRKQTLKWTTKDGTKVRICDMSDAHLINTIRLIFRKADAVVMDALCMANSVSGEIAEYVAEQEADFLMTMDIYDIAREQSPKFFDALVLEYNRRKLTGVSELRGDE